MDDVFSYKMNARDSALAHLAGTIIGAFSASATPHILPEDSFPIIHWTKHTDKGYSLLKDDCMSLKGAVVCTRMSLSEYVEDVFSIRAKMRVDFDRITELKCVSDVLDREYGSPSLKVLYACVHDEYGECLVCSSYAHGAWVTGYYCFDEAGGLVKKQEIH